MREAGLFWVGGEGDFAKFVIWGEPQIGHLGKLGNNLFIAKDGKGVGVVAAQCLARLGNQRVGKLCVRLVRQEVVQ